MRIHQLNELVATQIAAGEVIERPASVVKELVENSLDAKATAIRVSVKQGGHERITVSDDGQGIHADDLMLAFQRHATSKIVAEADLQKIRTLGFRGEALASIGAVARVSLSSRQQAAAEANQIICEWGLVNPPTRIGHPIGTTISVDDIFLKLPARRKFLRTPQTEFLQIETLLQRIALSQFDIHFSLHHQDKLILDFPKAHSDALQSVRIGKIFGQEFTDYAIMFSHEQSGMRLSGWLAEPRYTRAQADFQYWYVNGRFIRDKLLAHAAREAYHDVLFHGRHPAYCLYLEIDPQMVDVNIHPTKQEVRFRDTRLVHDFVRHSIEKTLNQIKPGVAYAIKPSTEKNNPCTDVVPMTIQSEIALFSSEHHEDSQSLMPAIPTVTEPLGNALAQLQGIYILAENKYGLIIVDMHAAHERVLYEKMKSELASQSLTTQALLIPNIIRLNPKELLLWQSYQNNFNELGIESDAFGVDSIAVRRVPSLLKSIDIERLIRDVLADLNMNEESSRLKKTEYALLGNIACRASVHGHRQLTLPEMNALLHSMQLTTKSSYCNHGRPTWKQVTMTELDHFFKRGQ